MDSTMSVIASETFLVTTRSREHHLSKHTTSIFPSGGSITGPSQEQIWMAMEWARLGGD